MKIQFSKSIIRFSLALVSAFSVGFSAFSQVSVDLTLTPQQLVENILLGGGISVSNVTFNGQPGNIQNNQICKYNGPSNVVSFNEGIFMASGAADQIIGGFSEPASYSNGDADLFSVANSQAGTNFGVNNQAILEFDFIPTGDMLNIQFVFCSQEYPGYTCSSFNDPFAFFISGPGISGPYSNNAANIALIPNSTTPIAVNTINGGVPTGGGSVANCLAANPNFVADSQYFVANDNMAAGDVQFPGLTMTLLATSPVICGETYHIKLAVADVSDGALDSGVFLAAGSFESSGYDVDIASSLTNVYGSPIVYEGCEPVTINLTKGGCNADDVEILFLTVTGTAEMGVDYESIPPFVTFPVGENTVSFDLNVFADVDPEGPETLIITIEFLNNEGELETATATLTIFDYTPISLTLDDFNVPCPGDPVTINAGATGGVTPLTYSWNTGQTTPSITVDIPATTTFNVTVSDFCGFTAEGSSVATLIEWPPFVVSNQTFNTPCPGDIVSISPAVSGGSLPYTYAWVTGETTASIDVSPQASSSYNVVVSDQCGSLPAVVDLQIPVFDPVVVITMPEDTVCGGSPGAYLISGGNGNYTNFYSDPEGFTFSDNNGYIAPTAGVSSASNYLIYAVDQCGNTGSTPVVVVGCNTTVPNIFSPNGDNINDVFIIEGLINFPGSRLAIYNRWGQMVYESTDYQNDWKGGSLEEGTYFYVLNRADQYDESGYVVIVRK